MRGNLLTSAPPKMLSLPTSPPLAVTRSLLQSRRGNKFFIGGKNENKEQDKELTPLRFLQVYDQQSNQRHCSLVHLRHNGSLQLMQL